MDEIFARIYLAGILDGEGSIGRVTPKTRNKIVHIDNTDEDIINVCIQALQLLGIEYRIHCQFPKRLSRKIIYRIVIARMPSVKRVFELIPLQCLYKKERLRAIVESYNRIEHVNLKASMPTLAEFKAKKRLG